MDDQDDDSPQYDSPQFGSPQYGSRQYGDPNDSPQASWVEADAGTPVSAEKNWWPTCLVGCLVMVVVLMVLAAIGGYLAVKKGPAIAAKFVRNQVVEQIQNSELPVEEKDELIHQLDRVVTAFENGELDKDDLERVAKELAKSPIVVAGILMGVEEKYFKPSGLSDDEKAEARKAIQRAWRGCVEEKIDIDELKAAFEVIAEEKREEKREGKWELKPKLTDGELREFVAKVKTVADEHEIPDETFEIDVSDEVRRLVDRLLNEDTSPDEAESSGDAGAPPQTVDEPELHDPASPEHERPPQPVTN